MVRDGLLQTPPDDVLKATLSCSTKIEQMRRFVPREGRLESGCFCQLIADVLDGARATLQSRTHGLEDDASLIYLLSSSRVTRSVEDVSPSPWPTYDMRNRLDIGFPDVGMDGRGLSCCQIRIPS